MGKPTAKHKRLKINPGDVFEIAMPDRRLAYGVIIEKSYKLLYVMILNRLFRTRPDLANLLTDEIALVGWTMDALIYHGEWQIVFSDYPARADVPYPNFKVEVSGEIYATDFRGKILGLVRSDGAELLDFQPSWTPAAFQSALYGLHGYQTRRPDDAKLTPGHARQRMTPPPDHKPPTPPSASRRRTKPLAR